MLFIFSEKGRMKMKTLLLVDGHNLLFQMFFGMPSRIIGRNGKSCHAAVGFIGAFLKTVKLISPTHALVIFDGEDGSFRAEENENYKADRTDFTDTPDDENPFSQLEYIKTALDFIGVKNYEISEKYEADDVISAYAKRYGGENCCRICIMSADTDLFQLISDSVYQLVYRGKNSKVYDRDAVFERYGVLPEYFADFKALVGDASDNIKGVRGIGPKTAAALISELGFAENIIENSERIKKPSIRTAITENSELILQNLSLIRLDRCKLVPFEIGEFKLPSLSDKKTTEILRGAGIL